MWEFRESEYRQWMIGAQARFQSGARPDLFERYALPLDVSGAADIEKALAAIQGFWGKNKINPRFTSLLSVLLAEHREASGTLLDEERREDARRKAEALREQRQQERFAALRQSLEVTAAKGYLTPAERDELFARYKSSGLTEAEVQAVMGVTPVHEHPASGAGSRKLNEGLPKLLRDELTRQLAVLSLPDLFAFLHIGPGSTAAQWNEAHAKREKEWRQRPSNYRKTAADVLLGLIKVQIVPDPSLYEQARLWERMELLRRVLVLPADDKRIDPAAYEALLKQASKLGLGADDAASVIQELARQAGATLEITAVGGHLTCSNCHHVLPLKGAPAQCPNCSHALSRDCPQCGTTLTLGAEVCGVCHFAAVNLPRAEKLQRQAERALEQGRDKDAEEAINDAEAILDSTSPMIVQLRQKLGTWRERVAALAAAAHRQHEEQSLYTLADTLRELRTLAPGITVLDGKNPVQLLAAVQEQIGRAEQLVAAGVQNLQAGDAGQAETAFAAALEIARDCDAARRQLEACPPSAPHSVSARLTVQGVEVVWQAGPARSPVTFRVVRAEGAAVSSPDEGALVALGSALQARDSGAAAGSFAFYSVFACRAKAVSAPAQSAGVLVAVAAAQLSIEGGDRVVLGSWTVPPAGAQARVVRKVGSPPAHLADGEMLPAQPGGFTDRNVQNGGVYYYGVLIEYQTPRGNSVLSPLTTARVCPQAPLSPVSDLAVRLRGTDALLTWTQPESGEVWIYRLEAPPAVSAPMDLPLPAAWGQPMDRAAAGQTVDPVPAPRQVYYLPVTVSATRAMPGTARRFAAVADVTALKVNFENSGPRLTWTWPREATHALVLWNPSSYPADPAELSAGRQRVEREPKTAQGGLDIPSPVSGPSYFTVFAGYLQNGQDVYSAALSPACQTKLSISKNPHEIAYRFERVKGPFNSRRVLLKLKALAREVPVLPEMAVLSAGKAGIQSAAVIHRFGGGVGGPQLLLPDTECAVEIELTQLPSILSLQFCDPNQRQRYRLTPAGPSAEFRFT